MQTYISVLDLQLRQVCNHDIKFYSYICYLRKFDITREYFLVEIMHKTKQFVSLLISYHIND